MVIYDWVQHRYCRNCRLSREKFPTRRVFVQISVIIRARCCLQIDSIQGVALEIYQEYSVKYSGAFSKTLDQVLGLLGPPIIIT